MELRAIMNPHEKLELSLLQEALSILRSSAHSFCTNTPHTLKLEKRLYQRSVQSISKSPKLKSEWELFSHFHPSQSPEVYFNQTENCESSDEPVEAQPCKYEREINSSGFGHNNLLQKPPGESKPSYSQNTVIFPDFGYFSDVPIYSKKVMVSSCDWRRLNIETIKQTLADNLNPVSIHLYYNETNSHTPAFVFLTFRYVDEIMQLLKKCVSKPDNCELIYEISPGLLLDIIPWDVRNNRHILTDAYFVFSKHDEDTVFVSGLYRMTPSVLVYKEMTKLFGHVLKVDLQTDEYGFPLGLAKVTFANRMSYLKAIDVNQILPNLNKEVGKLLRVDPYVKPNEICSVCMVNKGPFFCRDPYCLKYFCIACFRIHHKRIYFASRRTNVGLFYRHQIMLTEKIRIQKQVSTSVLSSIFHECYTGFDCKNC